MVNQTRDGPPPISPPTRVYFYFLLHKGQKKVFAILLVAYGYHTIWISSNTRLRSRLFAFLYSHALFQD